MQVTSILLAAVLALASSTLAAPNGSFQPVTILARNSVSGCCNSPPGGQCTVTSGSGGVIYSGPDPPPEGLGICGSSGSSSSSSTGASSGNSDPSSGSSAPTGATSGDSSSADSEDGSDSGPTVIAANMTNVRCSGSGDQKSCTTVSVVNGMTQTLSSGPSATASASSSGTPSASATPASSSSANSAATALPTSMGSGAGQMKRPLSALAGLGGIAAGALFVF